MESQLGLFGGEPQQPVGLQRKAAVLTKLEQQESTKAFVEQMRQLAYSICRKQGEVSANDLRQYAAANNIEAPHPNAWGAIFRGRMWKFLRFATSDVPCRNGSTIRVWTLADM